MRNEKRSSETADQALGPELQAAVAAILDAPICSQAVERVKARAAELEKEANGQSLISEQQIAGPQVLPSQIFDPQLSKPPLVRRQISKPAAPRSRRLQLVAIAAGILLLACAAWLLPTPPTAFAQVIEHLKSASDFRYKQLVYLATQEAPIEVDVMVSKDGRERHEMRDTVSIHDAGGRVRLTLIASDKTAIVHKPSDEVSKVPARQLRWLEQLKSHGNRPDKDLGAQDLDGRRCQGFEVKIQQSTFSIWIDNQSNELVQIEFIGMPEGSPVTKSVMKDFRFNQTFDEKMFKYEPPEGYKVIRAAPPLKLLPGEESLVEALRSYTEISQGNFPKSISDWGEWAVLVAEKGVSSQESSRVMSRLGAVLPFLVSMPKEDYAYLGAGRTVGEGRTIVFWYRKADGKYRAIYSDFSVAEILETDVPSE